MERKKEKERKKERVKVQNIETGNQIDQYRCQQIKFTMTERIRKERKRKQEKKGKFREHRDR